MNAVELLHVSKIFRRHTGRVLLRDRLKQMFAVGSKDGFPALTDVTFRVAPGECVGIVGHNGAGKSTLLNLITRLCLPTSGALVVNGRVAPLLELGSGFHGDLTGAENLRVYASLLGLNRKETERRIPQILEFSGVADFIGEPLRTYSSGMSMRLAFAIAIHTDPDILIIDEVLGVGDQSFVEQCTGRLQQFRREGKTMICVSHSAGMIETLCDRVLWLDHGRLVQDGPVGEVLEAYYRSVPHRRELVQSSE